MRGLHNLWRWKRIIWQDQDWDYAYLLRIMEFKMANMHEFLGGPDAVGEQDRKDLDNLARAVLACRMLRKDWNHDHYRDYVMTLLNSLNDSLTHWWD
jgi:hypothetical protein